MQFTERPLESPLVAGDLDGYSDKALHWYRPHDLGVESVGIPRDANFSGRVDVEEVLALACDRRVCVAGVAVDETMCVQSIERLTEIPFDDADVLLVAARSPSGGFSTSLTFGSVSMTASVLAQMISLHQSNCGARAGSCFASMRCASSMTNLM